MNIDLGRGCRLPAYCSSLGKVLLSGLTEEEFDSYLVGTVFIPCTQYTVLNARQLRNELDVIRRQGYVVNDRQVEISLRSIAVPIYSLAGKVVAAMNVEVNAMQVSVKMLEEQMLLPLLQAAADQELIMQA